MDVSADADWASDWLHVAFLDENLPGLFAQVLHLQGPRQGRKERGSNEVKCLSEWAAAGEWEAHSGQFDANSAGISAKERLRRYLGFRQGLALVKLLYLAVQQRVRGRRLRVRGHRGPAVPVAAAIQASPRLESLKKQ